MVSSLSCSSGSRQGASCTGTGWGTSDRRHCPCRGYLVRGVQGCQTSSGHRPGRDEAEQQGRTGSGRKPPPAVAPVDGQGVCRGVELGEFSGRLSVGWSHPPNPRNSLPEEVALWEAAPSPREAVPRVVPHTEGRGAHTAGRELPRPAVLPVPLPQVQCCAPRRRAAASGPTVTIRNGGAQRRRLARGASCQSCSSVPCSVMVVMTDVPVHLVALILQRSHARAHLGTWRAVLKICCLLFAQEVFLDGNEKYRLSLGKGTGWSPISNDNFRYF